ncbi:MAG: preprotein translocase subunit SecA [Calditrichia bacterium]
MIGILSKIFGTRNDRELKKLWPYVAQINEVYEKMDFNEEGILKKSQELRAYVDGDPAKLDDIMIEAFALAKYAAKKLVGKKYMVMGHEVEWNMVPFDVQLLGGIVLHQGKIAEMATGEGKTLVATMPLYLNALVNPENPPEGYVHKGVHLVTVNDYLAQRDMEWMRPIYESLGVSVGVILGQMTPEKRREAYYKDITYGTNNEFGFDYLRDNMAISLDEVVQVKDHFFAIVDEVDSVLIDEARTPLIISGPVEQDTHQYSEVRPMVEKLVRAQTSLVNKLVAEAKELYEKGEEWEAGRNLLLAHRGGPKNRQLLKIFQDPSMKKLMRSVEDEYLRDKKLHVLDEELYFVIEERNNLITITDKGRQHLSPSNPEMFVLPDLTEEFAKIEEDESLSEEDKIRKKNEIQHDYTKKNEINHNIQQLLKAYMLFEKDVDYVVTDGKVMIVDEFTGRIMHGRRYSDGLHQALEAKENVKIERETQTFATITLQNYFRMYDKLAGMTGTAYTEAQEFWDIYKLDVIQVPTNRPVRRMDYNDLIYKTRRAKFKAVVEEIKFWHAKARPILVGTISVESSETLSRLLKREKIPHKVLNAKYHKEEAEIVSRAGQPGAVTIATNMAGRGTDIKLGTGVIKCQEKCYIFENDTPPEGVDPEECKKQMPCGLHIIGTERHEARRIDLQLKGRSGRQGDPGSSKFFLSLEDDLMRLFGSDRMLSFLEKRGFEEDEAIEASMITKAIERAQKKVEMQNYAIRKRLLEYDDVMNKQREIIYERRNIALRNEDVKEELEIILDEFLDYTFEEKVAMIKEGEATVEELASSLMTTIFVDLYAVLINAARENGIDKHPDMEDEEFYQEVLREVSLEEIRNIIKEKAWKAYKLKLKIIPEEELRKIEKFIMLRILDEEWKDHLYEMDLLKEGIHLRAYGQKDPLVEYKREAYRMFGELIIRINQRILQYLWSLQPVRESELYGMKPKKNDRIVLVHSDSTNMGFQASQSSEETSMSKAAKDSRGKHQPVKVDKSVGPNDPCPCGSGKKYKKCHGAAAGVPK